MRLVKVDNPRPEQVLVCLLCGTTGYADRMIADLDGPAYRAYYHDPGCRPDNFARIDGETGGD